MEMQKVLVAGRHTAHTYHIWHFFFPMVQRACDLMASLSSHFSTDKSHIHDHTTRVCVCGMCVCSSVASSPESEEK